MIRKNSFKKQRGSSIYGIVHNNNNNFNTNNNNEIVIERTNSFHKPPSNFKKSTSESIKSCDLNHGKSNSITHHTSLINESSEANYNNPQNTDFGTAKFEFKGKNVVYLYFDFKLI